MRNRHSFFANHRLATAGRACLQALPVYGRGLSAGLVQVRTVSRKPERSGACPSRQASRTPRILASALILLLPLLPVASIAQVSVSLPTLSAPYGTIVQAPVQLGAVSQDVFAAELVIAYDAEILTPQTPQTAGSLTDGWMMAHNIVAGADGIDTLKVAMATAQQSMAAAGTLLFLPLQLADLRQPTTTSLQLVRVVLNEGQPAVSPQHGALTLTGVAGALAVAPEELTIGETLTITVADADENADPGAVETLQVEVSCGLQTEWVALTETGPNTGIFTGTIPTREAETPTSGSGVLELQDEALLTVTYADQLAGCGNAIIRQETVQAASGSDSADGVDGLVRISRVIQGRDGRHALRDTLRIEVVDADLQGSAEVLVINTATGEQERVTAYETGPNTGIFQARLVTVFGQGGADHDGALAVSPSPGTAELLEVRYEDEATAAGVPVTRTATAYAIDLFGDMTADGTLSALDASHILSASVGLLTPGFEDSLAADVDGDGQITAHDASLVLSYLIGLSDRFPVQMGTAQQNHPFPKPAAGASLLAIDEYERRPDGSVILPLRLHERAGIVSGQAYLRWDSEVEIVAVRLAPQYENCLLAHRATADGLHLAFAGGQTVQQGPGEVIELHLRLPEGTAATFSLDQGLINGVPVAGSSLSLAAPLPHSFTLYPNHPNPFNPSTLIRYDLPQESRVELSVYDLLGRRIRTLIAGYQPAGTYQQQWDGRDEQGRSAGSGVYLLALRSGHQVLTQKMTLLR